MSPKTPRKPPTVSSQPIESITPPARQPDFTSTRAHLPFDSRLSTHPTRLQTTDPAIDYPRQPRCTSAKCRHGALTATRTNTLWINTGYTPLSCEGCNPPTMRAGVSSSGAGLSMSNTTEACAPRMSIWTKTQSLSAEAAQRPSCTWPDHLQK